VLTPHSTITRKSDTSHLLIDDHHYVMTTNINEEAIRAIPIRVTDSDQNHIVEFHSYSEYQTDSSLLGVIRTALNINTSPSTKHRQFFSKKNNLRSSNPDILSLFHPRKIDTEHNSIDEESGHAEIRPITKLHPSDNSDREKLFHSHENLASTNNDNDDHFMVENRLHSKPSGSIVVAHDIAQFSVTPTNRRRINSGQERTSHDFPRSSTEAAKQSNDPEIHEPKRSLSSNQTEHPKSRTRPAPTENLSYQSFSDLMQSKNNNRSNNNSASMKLKRDESKSDGKISSVNDNITTSENNNNSITMKSSVSTSVTSPPLPTIVESENNENIVHNELPSPTKNNHKTSSSSIPSNTAMHVNNNHVHNGLSRIPKSVSQDDDKLVYASTTSLATPEHGNGFN
jgi:hypothetical protein